MYYLYYCNNNSNNQFSLLFSFGRSTLSHHVTSSELLCSFSVKQLVYQINILSVFNDKLLISGFELFRLYIYSREGHFLHSITLRNNDKLQDAAWTPLGNIVYTTISGKVVAKPNASETYQSTKMKGRGYLSVSPDGIIYLGDSEVGVYQSTDEGLTWSLVFKVIGEWHCWRVVKVTATSQSDDFFTYEYNSDSNYYQLRIYNVARTRLPSDVTWNDVHIPTAVRPNNYLDLISSTISYDGSMNVFLSDFSNSAVYVFTVNGTYQNQLLALNKSVLVLDINRAHQLLCLGLNDGEVSVYKLIYNST